MVTCARCGSSSRWHLVAVGINCDEIDIAIDVECAGVDRHARHDRGHTVHAELAPRTVTVCGSTCGGPTVIVSGTVPSVTVMGISLP